MFLAQLNNWVHMICKWPAGFFLSKVCTARIVHLFEANFITTD